MAYLLKGCPRCSGDVYEDTFDQEWRCLNCGRPIAEAVNPGRVYVQEPTNNEGRHSTHRGDHGMFSRYDVMFERPSGPEPYLSSPGYVLQ